MAGIQRGAKEEDINVKDIRKPFAMKLFWAPLVSAWVSSFLIQAAPTSLSTFSAHDPSRMVYDPVGNRWLIFYTGNGVPFAVSTDQKTWTHALTPIASFPAPVLVQITRTNGPPACGPLPS